MFSIFDLFNAIHLSDEPPVLAGTNLHYISPYNLDANEKISGVSGGVVLWLLQLMNEREINVDQKAAEVKSSMEVYCPNFYGNDIMFMMWKILCNNTSLRNEISAEELINLKNDPKEWPSEWSEDKTNFMRAFHELRTYFPSVASNREAMEECVKYLIEESSESGNKTSRMKFARGMPIKPFVNSPTEEEIFDRLPHHYITNRFNFIVKWIFPQLDKTPKDEFLVISLMYPSIKSYGDLFKAVCERDPQIVPDIDTEFKNMVVMHFDMCYKPWDNEFAELAEGNPELYKIIYVFLSYVTRLFDFENIDDWKEKLSTTLNTAKAQEVIDKLRGEIEEMKIWEGEIGKKVLEILSGMSYSLNKE